MYREVSGHHLIPVIESARPVVTPHLPAGRPGSVV